MKWEERAVCRCILIAVVEMQMANRKWMRGFCVRQAQSDEKTNINFNNRILVSNSKKNRLIRSFFLIFFITISTNSCVSNWPLDTVRLNSIATNSRLDEKNNSVTWCNLFWNSIKQYYAENYADNILFSSAIHHYADECLAATIYFSLFRKWFSLSIYISLESNLVYRCVKCTHVTLSAIASRTEMQMEKNNNDHAKPNLKPLEIDTKNWRCAWATVTECSQNRMLTLSLRNEKPKQILYSRKQTEHNQQNTKVGYD